MLYLLLPLLLLPKWERKQWERSLSLSIFLTPSSSCLFLLPLYFHPFIYSKNISEDPWGPWENIANFQFQVPGKSWHGPKYRCHSKLLVQLPIALQSRGSMAGTWTGLPHPKEQRQPKVKRPGEFPKIQLHNSHISPLRTCLSLETPETWPWSPWEPWRLPTCLGLGPGVGESAGGLFSKLIRLRVRKWV